MFYKALFTLLLQIVDDSSNLHEVSSVCCDALADDMYVDVSMPSLLCYVNLIKTLKKNINDSFEFTVTHGEPHFYRYIVFPVTNSSSLFPAFRK
jgi:hypothetical protein